MRLAIGSPVHCGDDHVGELADVVVDPTRRRVTHLVVEPHHRHRLARLVPVDLAGVDEAGAAIALRCSAEELRRFPPVEEFAYVRLGELALNDPDWDVGVEHMLAGPYFTHPYDDGWADPIDPVDFDPHVWVRYDRVPRGEVEIRRASGVLSRDGHHVGRVDGFVVDGDEQITHLVLERGHLFGRREVAIPIGSVTKVETDSVALALTKDQVTKLPAVPLPRWPAVASGKEVDPTEQSSSA